MSKDEKQPSTDAILEPANSGGNDLTQDSLAPAKFVLTETTPFPRRTLSDAYFEHAMRPQPRHEMFRLPMTQQLSFGPYHIEDALVREAVTVKRKQNAARSTIAAAEERAPFGPLERATIEMITRYLGEIAKMKEAGIDDSPEAIERWSALLTDLRNEIANALQGYKDNVNETR